MKKHNDSIIRHFWGNLPLLLSAVTALCLFLSPSLLLAAAVAVAVLAAVYFAPWKAPASSGLWVKAASMLTAAMIAYWGYDLFSSRGSYGTIAGLLLCAAGFYAMYVLSLWLLTQAQALMKEQLPVQEKDAILSNIKKNWYFPISAMGLYCLNLRLNLGILIAAPISFLAAVIIASQVPSLLGWARKNSLRLRVVSLLTAAGVCWGQQAAFCRGWVLSPKTMAIKEAFPIFLDLINLLSILAAVVGMLFVYICVLAFWKKMVSIFSEISLFSGITKAEWVIFGLLIVFSLGMMAVCFAQSRAFYETELSSGVIGGALYTSDSSLLVQDGAFVTLTNPENDIRQPLFAAFAAPFVGIPYLLAGLLGNSTTVQAILMQGVQILLLFAAHLMLAKMMKLDSIKRICFMLLMSCTYTQLLFTVMMEQYIIAYFWMMFTMYLISERHAAAPFALCGAGGTLITSMLLLPFTASQSPLQSFQSWFREMEQRCFEFAALMLVLFRFDVIFNITSKLSFYMVLSGGELTWMDKLRQYTAFLHDWMAAPNAEEIITSIGEHTWQLNQPEAIHLVGIVILLLAIVSTLWNRDKKSSQFAFTWVGMSAAVLLLLGWGTTENGLILYSLYFGWAFLTLLFQLVEKVEQRLHIRFLVPAISLCGSAALAAINIPAFWDMVQFVIRCYPT